MSTCESAEEYRQLAPSPEQLYHQIKRAVAAADSIETEKLLLFLKKQTTNLGVSSMAKCVIFAAAQDVDGLAALQAVVECLGEATLALTDARGQTVVHLAAASQTAASMEFFKRKLQTAFNLKSALTAAASNGSEGGSAFQWLVTELGTNCLTERAANGDTAIHVAARYQTSEMMEFIKEKLGGLQGFKLRGMLGMTAVHCAAHNATDSALVWLVRELGPDCLTDRDVNQNTVIHLCAEHQNPDVMRFIKESLCGVECFKLRGVNGRTVVHSAAFNKLNSSVLEWLVEELGPDCLTVRDDSNCTVIHNLAEMQTARTMQFIKDKFNDIQCFKLKRNFGRTVAHSAAFNQTGNSTLEWLVNELGPDCLIERDANNDTVIHIAAEFQREGSMRLIKQSMNGIHGFKLRGMHNRTAMHCAARNEYSSSAFHWLVSELEPDCLTDRDDSGDTVVHVAAECRTAESMQLIKEAMRGERFFQLKGRKSRSVAHCAASNDWNSSALEWLVTELGPECLLAVDETGDSVLTICEQLQSRQLADQLSALVASSLPSACDR